ncbi:DUF1513 domain-containing protein [Dongia sp.]|uniref:DUF1513 domain-containing protein n=1 Tax=Dongia sp. TaxID=1977262 RepID=UPI0035AD96CA
MALDRILQRRAQSLDMAGSLPAHLAACGDNAGGTHRFAAMAFDSGGRLLWRRDIDFRAHDVIAHTATRRCAIIGRKPGPIALMVDLVTGELKFDLVPLANCSFDGHAIFSADGSRLFTTQSEGREQSGRIVGYDLANGTIVSVFNSHGIEPHELLWSPARDRIVVGNGGILDRNATDPIDSCLVWIDAATGALVRKIVLGEDDETLSLRHIAVLDGDRIVCGVQDQDPATDLRSLVLVADSQGTVTHLDLPRDVHRRMAGYIGSVAVDPSGAFICATSPRGGVAAFWSTRDLRYVDSIDLPDTCGVAGGAAAGEFLLTSGHGARLAVSVDVTVGVFAAAHALRTDPLQWDNHLSLAR